MTGTCRTCHWWDRHTPPFDIKWGVCLLLSDDESRMHGYKARAIGRDPGEGSMVTSGEFGCIEFAPVSHPSAWVGEGSLA